MDKQGKGFFYNWLFNLMLIRFQLDQKPKAIAYLLKTNKTQTKERLNRD